MFSRTRGFLTAVCAVVILLLVSACGPSGLEPTPTDVCPNIAGVQSSIPSGMILDGNGNCVVPVLETLQIIFTVPATVFQDAQLFPDAVVSVTVNASSNKGTVTTVCTLDGKSAPCVGKINMTLGQHPFVAVATSVATGLTKTDSTTIVVLPLQIVGHVYVRTMTGEHCPSAGSYVIAGDAGSIQDSTLVNTSTCAFTLNTRYAGTPNARVVFQGDPNAIGLLAHVDSKYYARLDMVTMEKSLTIPLGQYAGQTKTVNLDLPYQPSGDPGGTSFFYRFWSGKDWQYIVGNYPTYPQPEQFCRNLTNQPITASDSTGHVAALVTYNQIIGQERFRMDSSANTCVTGIGRQLFVHDSTGKIPFGKVSNLFARDFRGAVLNFASEEWIANQFTNHHEGLHTEGHGHTCAWKTIMYTGCPNGMMSQTITVDDVFWLYVMQTMADGERLHNTVFGLGQAHQYWRTTHGESEEPVNVYEPY